MGITETGIIYLLLGVVVAGTKAAQAAGGRARAARVLELIAALLFWPLFAPGLLARATSPSPPTESAADVEVDLPRAAQAQARLTESIRALEGVGEQVLRPQLSRLNGMMDALLTAHARRRDVESMLATPELDLGRIDEALRALTNRGLDERDPRVRSLRARRRNVERLRAIRDRTADELERASLRLEEISSQVLLLRFAAPPAAELDRRLTEVSGSIEKLSGAVLEMTES